MKQHHYQNQVKQNKHQHTCVEYTPLWLCNSPVTAGFGVIAQLGIKLTKTRQEECELSTCLRSELGPPAPGSAIHHWHSAATGQGVSPRVKPLILHLGC